MDWSNERYVRLYTRDTPEWMCMQWQGRALWPLLIRKVDRSGVLATKLGARGIAVLVGLPIDVVEVGLKELLTDGCMQEHQLGYVIPNYIEAQETPQSDAQRQRDSRERRRTVTDCDTESQIVTRCHVESHAVTRGHTASHPVTPSLAEPNQIIGGQSPPDPAAQMAALAIGEINRLARTSFDPSAASSLKLARGLVKSKRSEADVLLVIRSKTSWISDAKMREFFRPKTLLGPENFASYLDEARAKRPGQLRVVRPSVDDDDQPPTGPDLNIRADTESA